MTPYFLRGFEDLRVVVVHHFVQFGTGFVGGALTIGGMALMHSGRGKA
ncbi:MAG: hypothetical protein ACFN4D_03865 [Cardiobacterium sp.]